MGPAGIDAQPAPRAPTGGSTAGGYRVRVTVILHAYRWPGREALESLRSSIASAVPTGLDLVEAREDERQAVGACALVNRAAASSAADALLVLEPSTWFAPEGIASVVRGSADGLAHDAEAPGRLWAIPRRLFSDAGGLDARLWSVGYVEDLAARLAARGARVTPIAAAGVWHGPDPYPLRSEVRDFLGIRNHLITAFKTCPDRNLGDELAVDAALALMRAWRGSGLDSSAFSFGTAARQAPRPADETATLVPLLALDAFLADLPALGDERERLRPQATAPAGRAPGRPSTRAQVASVGPEPGPVDMPRQTGPDLDVLERLRRLLDKGARR